MRWLGRPRPSGQHASVVIKVATNKDAEKLLKSDSITFGGGGIIVSPFEERHTPVACFKCRRFGYRARDCMRPETCDMCGQEGHLQCETVNLRCVNCQGPHRASHRECPEYRKEKDRILTRQHYGYRTPGCSGIKPRYYFGLRNASATSARLFVSGKVDEGCLCASNIIENL